MIVLPLFRFANNVYMYNDSIVQDLELNIFPTCPVECTLLDLNSTGPAVWKDRQDMSYTHLCLGIL